MQYMDTLTSSPSTLVERTVGGLHRSLEGRIPSLSLDASICDLGCGSGAWLDRLHRLGFNNLHGMDESPDDFLFQHAAFIEADLNKPIQWAPTFDLISAIEVIEHLENPGNLLEFVAGHLSTDGWFLLTTPNVHSLTCRLRLLITGELASFDRKGDRGHVYPVFLSAFEKILVRHGLRIVTRWTYPADGSLIYRRSLWFATRLLKVALPESLPGDTLCLLLRRA